MEWKFKSAELPCNEIEDFKTTDVSMDIICRVWLSDAPSEKHEKIMRELDGENYKPDCFYIESVAGKNEPDGDILTSDWLLYYVLDDGTCHEFGFVSEMANGDGYDVEGAWEFFKKEMFKEKSLDDKISHASERVLKDSEPSSERQVNMEL